MTRKGNKMEFFMAMIPPTVTHQEKQVHVVNGKPIFYEPSELKAARQKLMGYLAKYRPEEPLDGGIRLMVKWCFPRGRHTDGEYRITKPDTDNLQKLLKDCMTACKCSGADELYSSLAPFAVTQRLNLKRRHSKIRMMPGLWECTARNNPQASR